MHKLLKQPLSIFLFFTAVTGVLFLTSGESRAQGRTCRLELTKIAEGGEGLIFDFEIVVGGNVATAQLIGGETIVGNFGTGETATLTELLTPGWELVDISCDTGPGISATVDDGGLTLECLDPQEEPQGECVFTNVRVSNIPTLSEWGMIAAAAGLALIGVYFAVRRRAVKA